MKQICNVCFFALAFCGCSAADQAKAQDAAEVAAKIAECARQVSLDHPDADLSDPHEAVDVALDLAECAKWLPPPMPKKFSKAPKAE